MSSVFCLACQLSICQRPKPFPYYRSYFLEVRLLLERHSRELRAEEEKVEAAQVKVREAVREVVILRAKLQAIEGWRDHEIIVLRSAGRDSVDSLKVSLPCGSWTHYKMLILCSYVCTRIFYHNFLSVATAYHHIDRKRLRYL